MKIKIVNTRGTTSNQHRKSPWMVRYYKDRKAVRHFYETREQAEQKAADLRRIFNAGTNPDDLAEATRIAGGTGYSLAQLARMGLQHIKTSGAATVSPTITFREAAAKATEIAKKRNRRNQTLKSYRVTYNILNRAFGERCVTAMTTNDVEAFLDGLPNRKGEKGKAATYTRITLLSFIQRAMRVVGVENPLPDLVRPVPELVAVRFFTIDEVTRMLKCTPAHERGALAILLFAGLRPTLSSCLPEECVDIRGRRITIPDYLAKDKHGHSLEGDYLSAEGYLRPGLPNVLWAWLEQYPYQRVNWKGLRDRLRRSLGFWIHDGTRHTAATYYHALHSRDATKNLLTHDSPTMAVRHYIGHTTREAAEKFYALKPENFPIQAKAAKPPLKGRESIAWPPHDELAAMLQREPASHIARKLGCSEVGFQYHCLKYNIPKPPRGEWQRRRYGKQPNLTSDTGDHPHTEPVAGGAS